MFHDFIAEVKSVGPGRMIDSRGDRHNLRPMQREPFPKFSAEPWYSDPQDHRCPHDAWLESLEISEPAAGQRSEQRQTAIIIKLLGSYHDGWITFTYLGVKNHSLTSYLCDQGVGDWRRDEFDVTDAGWIVHRITWAGAAGETSQWIIEARDVSYAWTPKTDG